MGDVLSDLITRRQWGTDLAHRFALQLDLVGAVDDAIKNGIGKLRITQILMPMGHRHLACEERGAYPGPVVQDLQEIVAIRGSQRFQAPIVQDEQIDLGKLREAPREAPVTVTDAQFVEEPGHAQIAYGEPRSAGLVSKRAGKPRLAGAGRPGHDHRLAVPDPAAGRKAAHERPVETAGRARDEVFKRGVVFQARELQEPCKPPRIAA